MVAITVAAFQGENRALEPKLLPDGQGVVSLNQKPGRGDLRGWRVPQEVMRVPTGAQRRTIYRMGRDTAEDSRYWLSWPEVVHAVRGFDAQDTSERTYFTGAGAPKATDNLALTDTDPTQNPTVSRPLGVPAPTAPLIASVALEEPDEDEGKYWIGIYAKDVAGLNPGEEFRITVQGQTPYAFTLTAGEGGRVTPESFAAQATQAPGIRATAPDKDHPVVPLGVRMVAEAVGVPWTFERMVGIKEDLDPNAVSYQSLLTATGGTGAGTPLFTSQVRTAGSHQVLLPDNLLKTFPPGMVLACSVASTQRFAVTLGGNSQSAVADALRAAGVDAYAQPFVPETGGDTQIPGRPGGVVFTLTGVSVGQTITLSRDPTRAAGLVVTKAWLDANAKPGDRWQVTVDAAAPVLVALAAGANTYPPAVTAQSLRTALAPVAGLKLTEEVGPGGAPQLRVETAAVGGSAALAIKKVVPASVKTWGHLVAAIPITPPKRDVRDYFYTYTYVTDWGWESAPAPVSAVVERTVKETATLSGFAAPPGGGYGVNRIRVYRTQAGMTGNADFFFLREVPVGTGVVEDDGRDIGEVLPSKRWLPAPGVPRGGADNHVEEPLTNLTPMWNGMLAGITGGAVRFCEAYTPYAWPLAYDVVPPDATPVALGVFGQNLLVLTTGRPVLVAGSSPESLDQAPLEVPQGCISARSVVGMGVGVAWASNDGLCWYGAGGAKVLTAGVLTREDWLALRPETIIGQMYEGLYFGSYEPAPGAARRGFMVSPAGGGVFFLDEGFDAAFFDDLQDQLYLLRGNRILKWEAGGTVMVSRFRSRVHRQVRPVTFSCAEVVATAYPVQFKLWADGEVRVDRAVMSREPFRLPGGFLAMDWQVEVATPPGSHDGGVQAVVLAQTMQELAQL